MTEEVYKRPMFTMPAYRLFTLLLYWPLASQLARHFYVWLPAVDCAQQVINSGACLCKGGLPCFFFM